MQPRSNRYGQTLVCFACSLFLALGVAGCGKDDQPSDTDVADVVDAGDADDTVEPVVYEPYVDGNVRIMVLTPTLLRIEYAEDGEFEDRPSQLVGRAPTLSAPYEVTIDGDERILETEALTLRFGDGQVPFSGDNLSVEVRHGGDTLRASPQFEPLSRDDNSLGGWMRGLDLIASRQVLRPGLLSRQGWTLLDDTHTALLVEDSPGFVERPERSGAYQDGYFFGYGTDYRQALADLRHLAGPAPLLPRNALGNWFSRYYAYSAEEWQGVVDDFRGRDVPLDVLSLDTDWKRPAENNVCPSVNAISGARPDDPCSWNGWDWNYDIFPDPSGFLASLREQGLDVGVNIHPSINTGDAEYAVVEGAGAELDFDRSSPTCEFLQADLSNDCLVFDLLDQAQVDAYFELHAPIGEAGIDFWWFDWCCERTGRFVPGLTADTWINQLYYENTRALGSRWPAFSRMGGAYGEPEDDYRLLGAFAEHRQTMHFTGDTCSTWELLEFVGEFTVAEGTVGLPYVSHDIGSFHGEFEPGTPCDAVSSNPRMADDMFVRWIQFGTFQPLNRLHSNHGDRLPWEYPGEPETIGNEFLRLRGRLIPHLYTLSREAYDLGLPMARALYLTWPDQDDAYEFPAQFTLGDDLLVGMVAAPGDNPTVDVWIPPGTWHHFFNGDTLEGPQVASVEVPLAEYPVFARAGSILPMQPELPTSSRGPQDELTLVVWAGGDGTYSLYEDEGVGFGYETGEFRRTTITSASSDGCHTVTIGAAEGEVFPGALDERSWTIELRGTDDPGQTTVNGEAVAADFDANLRTARITTGVVASDQTTTIAFGTGCE